MTMLQPVEPREVAATRLAPLRRHLLDVDDLEDADVLRLLRRAAEWKGQGAGALPPTLRGQVVATVFFEPSTRTRLSFELAAQRLGALTMPFDVGRSSLEKLETLYDTLQTLAAMGVTMAVVRHRDNDVFAGLSQRTELSLINAGNGTEAHPTQALLDAFTLLGRLGRLDGRTIVITGDIVHSRVARSNLKLLGRLGARVIVCGPRELLPSDAALRLLGATSAPSLEDALVDADAVMCLRIQRERHAETSSRESSAQSYLSMYGLTLERFARARPDCVLLHPGPVNRDVELAASLVEHPRSLILEQVRNGLYMRMAVMEWLAGVLP